MYSLARHLALASVTGLALVCLCSPVWASDGVIRAIHFDPSSQHLQINASGSVRATVNTLVVAGHKRILLDIENAEIGLDLPRDAQLKQQLMQELPALRNITINQYGSSGRPIVRILLDIDGDLQSARLLRNQASRLELELTGSIPGMSNKQASASSTARSAYPNPKPANAGNSLDTPPSLPALRPAATMPATTSTSTNRPPTTASADASDVNRLKVTLVNLNRQYETMVRQNQDLKNQLNAQRGSSDATERLQEDIMRLKTENQALQGRLDAGNSLALSNSQEVSSLKQQLAAANRKAELLGQEKNQLKGQVDATTKLTNDLNALRLENNRLKAEKSAVAQQTPATSQVSTLQAENTKLRQQLAQQTTATSQVSTLQTENARLRQQLAQRGTATASSGNSDAELSALRKQVTTAQISMNEAIRTINEQNKEIAYLRNQISDVKSGMDASSREQIARIEAERDEKESTIRTLQRQLAAAKATPPSSVTSSAKTGESAETTALKRQLEKMTLQYRTDVDALNAQLQSRNKTLTELRNQATTADAEVETLQRQVGDLQSLVAEANRKAAAAQATASSREELAKRDQQIDALQRELEQLQTIQAQNAKTQAALASAKSELERLRKSTSLKDDSSAGLQQTVTRLTRENENLQATVTRLTSAQTVSEKKAATAASTMAQTMVDKAQLQAVQSELSSLKGKYDDLLKEKQSITQQLEAARQKAQKTTTTAKTTGSSPADAALQQQLAAQKQEVADLRQENESLRNQVNTVSMASSKQSAVSNSEAEQAYRDAKAAMSNQQVATALEQYRQAHTLDPDNSRYAVDYSIALAEDHRYSDGIEVLRRYLQRNTGDKDAYNQLGKLYLLNDQPDAANQAFIRAIPLNTLNNYATTLKKLDRMNDAEAVFKLALQINPRDGEVLFNLGNLYNASNKLDLAKTNYIQALQIRPNFAEAHYNLGLIYAKLGDNPQAITHLEKFLQLSPNARNAETIRAYIEKLRA